MMARSSSSSLLSFQVSLNLFFSFFFVFRLLYRNVKIVNDDPPIIEGIMSYWFQMSTGVLTLLFIFHVVVMRISLPAFSLKMMV